MDKKEGQIKRASFALGTLLKWLGYGLGAGGVSYGLWKALNQGILGTRKFKPVPTKLSIDPEKMKIISDYFKNKSLF